MQVVTGDATQPIGKGKRSSLMSAATSGHEAGFVLVSRRWAEPAGFPDELSYDTGDVDCPRRAGYRRRKHCEQHGIKQHGGQPPIRYDALRTSCQGSQKGTGNECVRAYARIGCGLLVANGRQLNRS